MPQTIGHFRHFITAIAALLCAANGLARADALPGMAGRLIGNLRYIDTSTSAVNTLTEQNITYDRSGNLLTLNRYDASSGTTPSESLSFSYSGPKRTGWGYDSHGNVTSDLVGSTTVAWNVLDMPNTISSGTAGIQRSYLADGTLVQVNDGSTTRLYLGDMVFNQTSGTISLESAGWDGGRLLPGSGTDKVLYYVTDHLGSVRVVKDASGAIRQRYDYYPYGSVTRSWTSSSSTDNSEKRFRFGGKEITGTALGALSIGADKYLDFGARLYSPGTAIWLSQDPMAESYYHFTPYLYCAGSPGNVIDPEGLTFYIVDGALIEIDDGYYDTVEVTQHQFNRLKRRWQKSESRYLKLRSSLMDSNGYTDSNGNQVLAASYSSTSYSSSGVMQAIAGFFTVDISVPDPSDVCLPKWGIYAIVGASYYYDKMSREIAALEQRKPGPQGVQYALIATQPGYYTSYTYGGGIVFLNTGDVWKYGETTHTDTRYSQEWRIAHGLKMDIEYVGSQRECKIQEKIKIYRYFFSNGHLPPGNKIFR